MTVDSCPESTRELISIQKMHTQKQQRGCTSDGIYVPCIYLHAR